MAKINLPRWLWPAALLLAPSLLLASPVRAQNEAARYPCESDLIEVMFAPHSRVRLRGEQLQDLAIPALTGVDHVLQSFSDHRWERTCDVPEETLDEMQVQGEANTGQPVYNLNNIYRLRIVGEVDVWALSQNLEVLPGVLSARPVPKPIPPQPGVPRARRVDSDGHEQRLHGRLLPG
jgi:hypothetical protein